MQTEILLFFVHFLMVKQIRYCNFNILGSLVRVVHETFWLINEHLNIFL